MSIFKKTTLARVSGNANTIALDEQSVHTIGYNGLAYLLIDDCLIVGVKFNADYKEQGEADEYWGGDLAVQGNSWIEVDDVWNTEVVEVYDSVWDDELPLECYVMTEDDEVLVKEVIEALICGQEPETKIGKRHFFA